MKDLNELLDRMTAFEDGCRANGNRTGYDILREAKTQLITMSTILAMQEIDELGGFADSEMDDDRIVF